VLSNSNNVISGNVALNHPNDRAIQIINGPQPGSGNQIVNNVVQNAGGEGIFLGAGSSDTNSLIAGNAVVSASASIFVGSSVGITVSGNTVTNTVIGLVIASSGHVSITANNLLTNSTGLSLTNSASNPVMATLNTLSGNGTGVRFNSGDAGSLLLNRNAIAGNGAGITNTAAGALNAECNWYGAADGPSGVGSGSGDSVSTGVDFNPWLLSDDLNGPCGSGSLTIQKVLVGPITPTTAWQFTATVPTGTLVFTLPAGGGAVTFSSLDFGPATIIETPKLGYSATSSCSTGAAGGASLSFSLAGNVTCTFTNTINPATTVITLTPVANNGWFYITETVGPGNGLLPFDIVLPPPDPTLGEASAWLVITDVNSRHMYFAFILTGTRLSDITVFEYRLRVPSASPQVPYINIGWDDDVTDGNTSFRGRLVYSPPSLPADAWHIVNARNDPTPRWYTTLTGATQCTFGSPCTFAQLVAAYPNAAIHPNTFFGVPRGFIGIRVGGTGATGTGYADGLRVGVGSQITLFDFEAAPPTTIKLTTNPTMTVVGSNVLLTATVTISNGDPAADGTVVSFTTSLGNVSPVTATTVGGVATATLSSTISGLAVVTSAVGGLSATALVTFTPGAPFSLTLSAVADTVSVGNTSTLTATATDQYGNAVADGTTISFTTSLGALSSGTANTSGGDAVVTLTSMTPGVANGDGDGRQPERDNPGDLHARCIVHRNVGRCAEHRAGRQRQRADRDRHRPVWQPCRRRRDRQLHGQSGQPRAGHGDDGRRGVATATLSSTVSGVAMVTATVGSLSATIPVTFTPDAPFTFTFTLTPTVIIANGISQSLGTVTVVDQYGNPVGGVTVNFLRAVGVFSPASGTTNANGQITTVLTSLAPAIENVFAVVNGLGFHGIQVTYVSLPTSSASLTSTLQTMTQTLGSVRKGDLITYTVTVTNTGAAQVSNVLIYAPIPNGTTYVAGSVNGGSYSNIFAMLLSGQGIDEGPLGPQAALSAVTWLGSLPGGASHTLSFAVQVQIMEGQVVNQFKVFVNNADTGMNLSGVVDVVAYKVYIPAIQRSQ